MLNEDTKRVIQELRRKNTNKQQQLRKLCFFNLEALAQDAAGQNLNPADIFASVDMKVISTNRTTVKMALLHLIQHACSLTSILGFMNY